MFRRPLLKRLFEIGQIRVRQRIGVAPSVAKLLDESRRVRTLSRVGVSEVTEPVQLLIVPGRSDVFGGSARESDQLFKLLDHPRSYLADCLKKLDPIGQGYPFSREIISLGELDPARSRARAALVLVLHERLPNVPPRDEKKREAANLGGHG